MGAKASKMNSCSEQLQQKCAREEYSSFESCEEFSIPDDLLVDVLSFVPHQDLIQNCRSVCKQWRDIIDGHGVWKIKCERERKTVPSLKLRNLPVHYYQLIYLFNPYGRNLIRNPCGEGAQYCFATSYYVCSKHQIIDLVAKGIPAVVLDSGCIKIQVGEWYAARFDCASEYKLTVQLVNEQFRDEEVFVDDFTVDSFEFTHREEQWTGKEWNLVTHTFDNVIKTRYVFFEHSGSDCQFWAGHFGSKMTGAFVRIICE
ncbi:F-box only protein 27-like isoform X2 [Stegodyphus dumicola]|uniref:F-box only protein 27-like isoform X2 n=1 Tax=Stegodyphus dumicola TaxID=202533 RepID=UPI0015A75E3E|nr:F-box only protein 27-like isoform X2 [Stegodyphus dumicola]